MRFSGEKYYPNKPRISKLLSRKHGLYLDLENSNRKKFGSDLCIIRHRALLDLSVGDFKYFLNIMK